MSKEAWSSDTEVGTEEEDEEEEEEEASWEGSGSAQGDMRYPIEMGGGAVMAVGALLLPAGLPTGTKKKKQSNFRPLREVFSTSSMCFRPLRYSRPIFS
jgi:hypothetical protein